MFCQRLRQRDIVHVDKNFIEDDLSAFLLLEGVDLTCVRRLSGMSNIHYSTGGPVHRRLGSRCNLASHVTLYSRPGEVSMNKYPDSHETLLGSSPLLVSTSLHREVNPPALVCRVHIKYHGNNHLKQPITMWGFHDPPAGSYLSHCRMLYVLGQRFWRYAQGGEERKTIISGAKFGHTSWEFDRCGVPT